MNILFGKRKVSKAVTKPTQTLSATFAQEVLDLEEQLNLNCTLPIVTRLMELYKKAIEFYEADKNLKHIHYQERMQNLLSRTNVIHLFASAQTGKPIVPLLSPASPKSKPNLLLDLAVERVCSKVINEHTEEASNLSKQLQINLKNQSETLSQRVLERKILTSPTNAKKFVFEEDNECDISAGKVNLVEIFEKEVESIMEKYAEEKIKLKKTIKDKYKEYLKEIKGFSADIREKLTNELQKNMGIEINEALEAADTRRGKEIARARSKLTKSPF